MAQDLMQVLSQIRGGLAVHDAGKELPDLIKAVKETGKSAEITLTIKIEPDKTDDTVVTLQPSVKIKKPTRPYAKGIFFVNDRTGALTREDPRQTEMELERKAELAEQGAIAMSRVGRGPGTE